MGDEYIRDKSTDDLLSDLYGVAAPGSTVHEQLKMAIFARCTDAVAEKLSGVTVSLEKAAFELNEAGKKGEDLSNKLYRLNWILTAATVVGSFATVLVAYPTLTIICRDFCKLLKTMSN